MQRRMYWRKGLRVWLSTKVIQSYFQVASCSQNSEVKMDLLDIKVRNTFIVTYFQFDLEKLIFTLEFTYFLVSKSFKLRQTCTNYATS